MTKEELRDGFSPGFDTVNELAAQLNQVRRDIEQIRRDLAEIKKAPVWRGSRAWVGLEEEERKL